MSRFALTSYKISHFDIGAEWLKALSMPQLEGSNIVDAVNDLTAKLQSKGYYLSISHRQLGSNIASSPMTHGVSVISNHVLIKSR